MSLLIRNGLVVTMNDRFDIVEGDVSIRDGRIAAIGRRSASRTIASIDARGGYVLPGFIQTHIHLCQTLFRGYADDLPLMDWLRRRVWPMEAAHTPATLRAAARLATTELLCSGTTVGADDGDGARHGCGVRGGRRERPARDDRQVHDGLSTDVPAAAAGADAGVDRRERRASTSAGTARPTAVCAPRSRRASRSRARASCSRRSRSLSRPSSTRSCTRTRPNRATRSRSSGRSPAGMTNIEYLASLPLASPRLCAAHCVWVDDREQQLLAEHDVKVMHCPGSNLKLGSGIAPVPEMRARGITVSLGADGAACNNRLDMFEEMRLAAVLQATRQQPGALPARDVLWMATRAGARTLGLEGEIGSIEVGKRADLIVVDRDRPHLAPGPDPYSTLVYAARGSDVRTTIVDGEVLVDEFTPVRVDRAEVAADARAAARELAVARRGSRRRRLLYNDLAVSAQTAKVRPEQVRLAEADATLATSAVRSAG